MTGLMIILAMRMIIVNNKCRLKGYAMKDQEEKIIMTIVNLCKNDPFEWFAIDAVELKIGSRLPISAVLRQMETKGWVEIKGVAYWEVRVTQSGIDEYCRVTSMDEPDEGTRFYNEFWSTTP